MADDTTAPTVAALTIPAAVDLSKGNAQFAISAKATDNLSGVRTIWVNLDKEMSQSSSLTSPPFSYQRR
jgi:hypothetical protein